MSVKSMEFMVRLSQYRGLFGVFLVLFLFVIIAILFSTLISSIRNLLESRGRQRELEENNLKNVNYSNIKDENKADLLRNMAKPDAVDPGPNSYLIVEDGGKEVYMRTLTIVGMPRNTDFAKTFAPLFDFPGCTSSVLIKPLSESAVSAEMDKQINVLSSEYSAAYGDPNRTRKIQAQYSEIYSWADQVESGDIKFFDVGFVFTLYADSLAALNKLCDTFRSKALAKSIHVSNCYAVQAEAYMQNAPFNSTLQIGSHFISTDSVKYFHMDKYSVSTIFNYTQSSFSHKDGVILGKNMDTDAPVFYDLFDASHDGFTCVIAGKTGSGKSATIKIYASRSILYDYHYVCIDSQVRKGTNEGEFASMSQLFNGVNYKISNDSKCIMNPFEIGETTKTIKEGISSVREVRSLELNDKISMVVHTLSTMIQGSKEFKNLEDLIPIRRILTDIVTQLYSDFGLVDGVADSLYEEGNIVVNGMLTSGRVPKKLPTLSDFYMRALISAHANKAPTLDRSYNLILMGLKDFVRELYYSEKTLHFFTKEQVQGLKNRDSTGRTKVYVNEHGESETVIGIHGIRAYFDGQSTVAASPDVTFTNIDISCLPESEKVLARQIAIDFVNEQFIKKNSEIIDAARKLVVIFDEAHENFAFEYARKTLDNVVRTARKRHVGVILSSQTLAEYQRYEETKAILKQATTKFVFKQDPQDKQYLMEVLGITDAQASYIVNNLGGNSASEEDKNRHRGEMCIVDNKNVVFCKVAYLKEEVLPVETDARALEVALRKKAG